MAAAVGAATIWRMRCGRGQDLQVDLWKAIHGINPMLKFTPTVNGYPYHIPYALGNPMKFDVYLKKDGRWFCPTGIYPHLLHAWCQFLQCSPESGAIRDAINKWDSADLDEAAAEKNLVFALCLSPDEWLKHPQGQQLAEAPLVEIVKIGDSEPEPFRPATRPLKGLRVLSATHVVAGNVMSRTLAEQGAEVLHLVDPQSFEHESLYIDACVGFQSSWLDFKQPEGRERALELARRADVFVENFRGRSMSNLGLPPQDLAARRPGIIYASGRCYSYDGPWAHRGGFDMEALCSSGFTIEEGTADRPAFPPTMIMNDYIAGYFGAAGIQAALIRRAKEGGIKGIVVTLDTWVAGWRPRDLTLSSFPQLRGHCLANYFSDPVFRSRLAKPPEEDPASAVRHWSEIFGTTLTWADLPWLRSLTKLPVLLKGICHPDDVRRGHSDRRDARVDGRSTLLYPHVIGRPANGGVGCLELCSTRRRWRRPSGKLRC